MGNPPLNSKHVRLFHMIIRKISLVALLFLSLSLVSGIVSADVKSLCKKSETVVWSCQFKSKVYSICSSKDLTETKGYLQYRAGNPKEIEFKYPAMLQHPKGLFEYGLLPHGAQLSFKNGHYNYVISEDLIGQPNISTSKNDNYLSTIECAQSTQSLTNNSTIEVFRIVGAYK